MSNIIQALTSENIKTIAELATTIWTNHYTPIIGSQQVAYMLDKYQSIKAIEGQIESGYLYYILLLEANPVGYFSFLKNKEHLFLSKLYVLKSARGNGIGKAALSFIADQTKQSNLNKIRLTVNKYNTNSIKAYEKMGFVNIEAVVQDIGNGYVMDDYVLEKEII